LIGSFFDGEILDVAPRFIPSLAVRMFVHEQRVRAAVATTCSIALIIDGILKPLTIYFWITSKVR